MSPLKADAVRRILESLEPEEGQAWYEEATRAGLIGSFERPAKRMTQEQYREWVKAATTPGHGSSGSELNSEPLPVSQKDLSRQQRVRETERKIQIARDFAAQKDASIVKLSK